VKTAGKRRQKEKNDGQGKGNREWVVSNQSQLPLDREKNPIGKNEESESQEKRRNPL